MFKYLNTPARAVDTQITHLSQTDRFHICYQTEALKDTVCYSLGCLRPWFQALPLDLDLWLALPFWNGEGRPLDNTVENRNI